MHQQQWVRCPSWAIPALWCGVSPDLAFTTSFSALIVCVCCQTGDGCGQRWNDWVESGVESSWVNGLKSSRPIETIVDPRGGFNGRPLNCAVADWAPGQCPDSQPPVAPQLASKSSTIGPHVATRGGPLLACTSNHYWPPTVGPLRAQAVGPMKAALSGPSAGQHCFPLLAPIRQHMVAHYWHAHPTITGPQLLAHVRPKPLA